MSSYLLVQCSFPDLKLAEEVAGALVLEGLAACVSLHEGTVSVYRWKGELCKEREVSALIKTSESRYAELEARILSMHSYTCPEIIGLSIAQGHRAYLDWIDQNTQPPSAP